MLAAMQKAVMVAETLNKGKNYLVRKLELSSKGHFEGNNKNIRSATVQKTVTKPLNVP